MFPSFPIEFCSDVFNLLLARLHQAEIIIVKNLIQGRNNESRLGVEPCDHGRRKNDAPNHCPALPTIAGVLQEIPLFHSIEGKLSNALLFVFESFVHMRSYFDHISNVSEKVM